MAKLTRAVATSVVPAVTWTTNLPANDLTGVIIGVRVFPDLAVYVALQAYDAAKVPLMAIELHGHLAAAGATLRPDGRPVADPACAVLNPHLTYPAVIALAQATNSPGVGFDAPALNACLAALADLDPAARSLGLQLLAGDHPWDPAALLEVIDAATT